MRVGNAKGNPLSSQPRETPWQPYSTVPGSVLADKDPRAWRINPFLIFIHIE